MRAFVFWAFLALLFPAFGAEIQINFGDYSQDHSLTNDFVGALAGEGRPGDWKIVTGEVPSAFMSLSSNAPAINDIPVLGQMDNDPDDNRFPMLIYNKETFKDFQIKTRFKILDGVVEQMAGVVFRFQNESNFYVIRVSALGHNLRFYKFINGQFVDPTTINFDISTGVWHTMTVQCEGDQINCWIDDHLVMPLETSATFPSGKVGFWTMADSVTQFGDTSIVYKPEVPMAQLAVQNIMEQQPRILELRIYTLDKTGTPRIIASNKAEEVGQAGTDSEKKAITDGAIFFGRGRGTVAVTMPLNDRNGNPVAAVHVQLRSFLGETQDTALDRARPIVQLIQSQVLTSQDLTQ